MHPLLTIQEAGLSLIAPTSTGIVSVGFDELTNDSVVTCVDERAFAD